MSTILYASVTKKRKQSDPQRALRWSTRTTPLRGHASMSFIAGEEPTEVDVELSSHEEDAPKASKWIDLAAALVPAEVLAAHALLLPLAFDTDAEGGTTLSSDSVTVFWVFVGMAILPAILYVATASKGFERLDILRAIVPSMAMVAWMMLQPTTMFTGFAQYLEWTPNELAITALGVLLASVAGTIAAVTAKRADEEETPEALDGGRAPAR